jgi:hypothetical protein
MSVLKLALWIVGGTGAVVVTAAIIGGLVEGGHIGPNRITTETQYLGIELGGSREDAIFVHGLPENVVKRDGSEMLFWEKSGATWSGTIFVGLTDQGKIFVIGMDGENLASLKWINKDRSYGEVIDRLGEPDSVESSEEGLTRDVWYRSRNLRLVFKQGRLTTIVVTSSARRS